MVSTQVIVSVVTTYRERSHAVPLTVYSFLARLNYVNAFP